MVLVRVAIIVPESLKVKNLCLESALCSVNREGLPSTFIYNTNLSLRTFRKGMCIADSAPLPVRIGTVTCVTDALSSRPHDDEEHAVKVRNFLLYTSRRLSIMKSGRS